MSQTTIVALAITLIAGASFAADEAKPEDQPKRIWEDDHGVYSLSGENDIIAGDDNNYTSGVRFSYFSPETDIPGWLENTADFLPFFAENGHKRWGFAVGQSMFTPNDISIPTPQPDDQPYAGWLYGSAGVVSDLDDRLDTFMITLGVVGPWSFAEQTQKFVHSTFDGIYPQGWRYQLENEPGLILSYERKWRRLYEFSPYGWGFDLIPSVGGNLGNIYTDASIGAVARFGYDLSADYGPPLIRPNLTGSDFFVPHRDFGWYMFAGLEGRGVARNIFLDGNTFEDSPSVDKKHLVGGVQAGMAFTFDDYRISYTHVIRTDQFESQRAREEFGSVNVSMRF